MDNGITLCDHLRASHAHELHKLSDNLLTELNIHVCKRCEKVAYASSGKLSSHINQTHVPKRSDRNLSIVTNRLFLKSVSHEENHWESGLHWLSNSYQTTPPPFRQSLLLYTKWKSLNEILDTFSDLIEATVEATKPPQKANDDDDPDFDSTPFWLLCTLFEQLVLAPRPKEIANDKSKETTTKCIYRRLRWFRAGRIEELYNESREVSSTSPSAFKSKPRSESYIEKTAQLAADNDNYKTANARITKDTPVAQINEDNLPSLQKLFPKVKYLSKKRSTKGKRKGKSKVRRFRNTNEIVFSSSSIIENILHLKRGKAPGPQIDSLDIFYHLANRCRHKNNKKKKLHPFADTLATFFTYVANSDIPEEIQAIFRSTYLVALQKDANDLHKLRPLGIPSAIRRVTANAIANDLRTELANYLLPFNYAVGIHGGIDFVTSTIRLGVEKYITQRENADLLPSRALVSFLDIRNMFNAISRHKLREIIQQDFPHLVRYVDALYEKPGVTTVKLADGTWEEIKVEDGFSQGCPLSPILAAIVLNHILRGVDKVLREKAATRPKRSSDDKLGGITTILAYVDDANFLVPLEDVELLLTTFKELAEPLGAFLNTEKTRILTSTKGIEDYSILPTLKKENEEAHDSLERAIASYSRKIINKEGDTAPCEVTDGLRILGVPIGCKKFCHDFHLDKVLSAQQDSEKLLDLLSDKQTMLRIFKTCTAHKITHLFASDVACSDLSDLPDDWHNWRSPMANAFNSVLDGFMSRLLALESLPQHAHLISTISIRNGGLGLQHPRLAAIPSFILSTKRAINYASNGIFLPKASTTTRLPSSITNLYDGWNSPRPTSKIFTAFNKYIKPITSAVLHNNKTPPHSISDKSITQFIASTSLPFAREELKHHAAQAYIIELLQQAPKDVLHALPGILLNHMSLPLVAMNRSDPKNRLSNKEFDTAIRSKLRLGIYPKSACPTCFCGETVDQHGDHFFKCGEFSKKTCSDNIRDTTCNVMKRIAVTAQYCSHSDDIDTERTNRVTRTPQSRPFDWSMIISHVTASQLKTSCGLSEVGIDVTIIGPSQPSDLLQIADPFDNSNSLLQQGEQGKFKRPRSSHNKKSGFTLSGDQFIGDLHRNNKALIPQAMDRWGNWGPLMDRFLIGDREAPDVFTFPASLPNATKMNQRACSLEVPYGILNTANKCWKESHPDIWYGDSYMDADPKSWALQQLGLGITRALVRHIHRSDKRVRDPSATSIYKRRRQTQPEPSTAVSDDDDTSAPPSDGSASVPSSATADAPVHDPNLNTLTLCQAINDSVNHQESMVSTLDQMPVDPSQTTSPPHDGHVASLLNHIGLS